MAAEQAELDRAAADKAKAALDKLDRLEQELDKAAAEAAAQAICLNLDFV